MHSSSIGAPISIGHPSRRTWSRRILYAVRYPVPASELRRPANERSREIGSATTAHGRGICPPSLPRPGPQHGQGRPARLRRRGRPASRAQDVAVKAQTEPARQRRFRLPRSPAVLHPHADLTRVEQTSREAALTVPLQSRLRIGSSGGVRRMRAARYGTEPDDRTARTAHRARRSHNRDLKKETEERDRSRKKTPVKYEVGRSPLCGQALYRTENRDRPRRRSNGMS